MSQGIQLLRPWWGNLTVYPHWEIAEAGSVYHRVKYIFGGEAWYSRKGKEIPLRPGTLYIFPSHRPYKLRHRRQNPLRCLWFHLTFQPDFLNELMELEILPGSVEARFIDLLAALVPEGPDRKPIPHPETLEGVLRELFHLIAKKLSFKTVKDRRILQALDTIRTRFAEKWSLRNLSEVHGIHPHYFARLFKKTVGVSPVQYLLHIRLQHAAENLQQKLSVREAARLSGFADEKFFSRIFRKHLGRSPRDYVKSLPRVF